MTKRETVALTTFGAVCLIILAGRYFGHPVKVSGITQIKVYALRPEMQQPGEKFKDQYFNYPILGSTTVTDPREIGKIAGVLNADLGSFVPKMCIFEPRHGVAIYYGSKVRDYVICYACGDVQKYDGGRMTSYSLDGYSSREPLTAILRDAGIAIAP